MNDAEIDSLVDELARESRATAARPADEGEARGGADAESEKPPVELTGQTNAEILAAEARAQSRGLAR